MFDSLIDLYLHELSMLAFPWPTFFSAFLISVIYFSLIRDLSFKELLQKAFSKDYWLHKSSIADVKIILLNCAIFAIILPNFVELSNYISLSTFGAFESVFGNEVKSVEAGIAVNLAFSFFILFIRDLTFWISHFMFHRVDFLWEFHKVHHSAERLTPLTTFRSHPISNWMSVIMNAIALGVTIGLVRYFIPYSVSEITIYSLNIFSFFSSIAGDLLTHSHIKVQWPKWMAKIIISPVNHQLHHSTKPEHFDKNFAGIFTFIDVIFGTYYHADPNEEYEFGVDDMEQDLQSIYIDPLKKSSEKLFPLGKKTA